MDIKSVIIWEILKEFKSHIRTNKCWLRNISERWNAYYLVFYGKANENVDIVLEYIKIYIMFNKNFINSLLLTALQSANIQIFLVILLQKFQKMWLLPYKCHECTPKVKEICNICNKREEGKVGSMLRKDKHRI